MSDPKGAAGAAKTPLQLLPSVAMALTSQVLKHGAEKYGEFNWRHAKVETMTYIGAIRRHLDAMADGQDLDPESGFPHIAHVAASCFILMDAADFGHLVDNRPPKKIEPLKTDGL